MQQCLVNIDERFSLFFYSPSFITTFSRSFLGLLGIGSVSDYILWHVEVPVLAVHWSGDQQSDVQHDVLQVDV